MNLERIGGEGKTGDDVGPAVSRAQKNGADLVNSPAARPCSSGQVLKHPTTLSQDDTYGHFA